MTIKKAITTEKQNRRPVRPSVYPFTALVGQEEMKLGLILNVIDPSIGGVLIMGHRGTGKSTAVRGLAELLPESWVVKQCPYRCDPVDEQNACSACRARIASGKKLERERARVEVVDLPLGATEDRVCGTIDIERALVDGVKAFEPGLLARANRGFLYIDEVNLLEDHLVDLLLDVAVTGQNKVERENISVTHPARFVLIGSGNPEEGELRPQLLDRFGLSVEVKTEGALEERVEIVERREAYDQDPEAFAAAFEAEQLQLRKRITSAQKQVAAIKVERPLLRKIAELCSELQIDGHRGEITITKAARSLAAFAGKRKVSAAEVKQVAAMALRHRLRRDPLEETAGNERIEQAVERALGETRTSREGQSGNEGAGGGRAKGGRPSKAPATGRIDDRRRVARAGSPDIVDGATTSMPATPLNDHRIPELPTNGKAPGKDSPTNTNRRQRGNSGRNHLRGRYVRATATRNEGSRLAVDATLRTAILGRATADSISSWRITREDLRFKELSCKTGRLFIFAIDTSGSMALHRIRQAKVVILNLLKQSYVRRDQVAIVGFRGTSAEAYLPPSRSILRARRVLESLWIGGGTPLAAGLGCSLKLAKSASGKVGEISVLVFTDGNANVALKMLKVTDRHARAANINQELSILGATFAKEKVSLTVVDTQDSFIRTGDAATIAKRLGAHYRSLSTKNIRQGGGRPPSGLQVTNLDRS
jgi:magnesium chelatase ATPase subunit I